MYSLKRTSSLVQISALSLLASSSFFAVADNIAQVNEVKANDALTVQDDSFFYLGAKGGWVNYQNACEAQAVDCDANDTAWGGFAGYQFHRNWGVEAGYDDFGQASAIYPETGLLNEYIGTMKGWEFSLKGNLPLTENLDLFGKAGTLRWDGDNTGPFSYSSDNGWSPMVGIGLEYKLTPSWAARVEYQYFDSVGSDQLGGSNIHFTSLGLSYRFGQTKSAAKAVTLPAPVEQVIAPAITPSSIVITAMTQAVHFDFDSEVPLQTHILVEVAEHLNQYPSSSVVLQGYTDAVGASGYNLKLSKRRAESVASYLKELGVSEGQISVEALGETHPEVDNITEAHRANNRRVYITIPELTLSLDSAEPAQ
ncbi:outer membrane protein/peptidoglycan-associated (lipo)protein [Shewanella psychrophila]|uniref:Outer membrane protein/peptidoglycan-associated (Lipo)protein n=1 Tax=Shewanella psychrophila TaxID=225848 RepID=A0A1S6HNA3_9GAMM|nr:outer membrane beta-barrel protein [Shewanella psychrophila]AQS36988.1 outer membrane protein/peptidoglycan-associated (lipo)protein [Shewanella psychrophila]